MKDVDQTEQSEQQRTARARRLLAKRREWLDRERGAWQPPAAPLHMTRRHRGRR